MGPSGAGKTTLINALTLDAHYGVAKGSVKLNGIPLTNEIFKEHCFVVPQQDKHWPYLTCRETLFFATQLYQVVSKEEEEILVDGILEKMGLQICADTANARLSGGQRRRLSIGIALIKQPRVLFLDEPTSGLDAASVRDYNTYIGSSALVNAFSPLVFFCCLDVRLLEWIALDRVLSF